MRSGSIWSRQKFLSGACRLVGPVGDGCSEEARGPRWEPRSLALGRRDTAVWLFGWRLAADPGELLDLCCLWLLDGARAGSRRVRDCGGHRLPPFVISCGGGSSAGDAPAGGLRCPMSGVGGAGQASIPTAERTGWAGALLEGSRLLEPWAEWCGREEEQWEAPLTGLQGS